jgi:hypothetical protein
MMRRTKLINRFTCWLAILAISIGCEELVEVDPPDGGLPSEEVFEDDLTAVAAISRLYSGMAYNCFYDITHPASLSADDLMAEASDNSFLQLYQNEIQPTNASINQIWSRSYRTIYYANSFIGGLEKSEKLTPTLKDHLLGEAKFFRAFCHFYLVNFFGDVPYITTTDYRISGFAKRMPVAGVYEKIIADLAEARDLLAEDYSYSKNERVRVNKWAATAMLARVYLYMEDWARAEVLADRVIAQTGLYTINLPLNDVFLKNSKETIWQLIPLYPQKYTTEGAVFLGSIGSYNAGNFTIPEELINVFEGGDKRKEDWIGIGSDSEHTWHYPFKYKEIYYDTTGADEYSTVLRLAEQYLIRAEARAKQNKLIGSNSAESDINIIRSRAGLLPTTARTQPELLLAIEQERRVEFFTEFGHRWFDLRRTGRADAVLSLVKPGWQATDMLYPIPYSELQRNPNLTP